MRVAIVHYHLRPGGVTRVMERAVGALASRGVSCAVLTGEPPSEPLDPAVSVRVEASLGYEGERVGGTPEEAATSLRAAAAEALGGEPDVWHIHNHALGKNLLFPRVVSTLAGQGRRLLLQLHDFAEDGRPANYRALLEHAGGGDAHQLSAVLYPQAPTVHYAALNARDFSFLRAAGVIESRLHVLPNPVVAGRVSEREASATARAFEERRLFLYSTRAIRRKNLGEFLLWSALADEDALFAVTMAPHNPAAKPVYERWVEFAEQTKLPVEFEAGARHAFDALVERAHALVTTSVAEGFGLAFLEPWLAGRPLVGRNLPEITAEFEKAGLDLSSLYERLDVPTAWLGVDRVRDRIRVGLESAMTSYGRAMTPNNVDQAFGAAVQGEYVDFGRLDETLQEEVLLRLAASPRERHALRPNTLYAAEWGAGMVSANGAAVERTYNLEQYADRLLTVYRALLESEPAELSSLEGTGLLDAFLDPARFYLIRT